MNSFQLTAIGNLARNPELVAKGDVSYTRFCVLGNDYAGKDDDGSAREIVSSLWFVAFGALGKSIASHARIGDQLIINARIRSNNWTDQHGEMQYDHSFIVENCGNSMILRCSASEGGGTSRFASTLIGQREVRRTTRSYSRRLTELFGATTRSEHFNIEPAVMDSEIEQLPDLCGYLKFVSRREWLAVRLQPANGRSAVQPEPAGHVPIDVPAAGEISAILANRCVVATMPAAAATMPIAPLVPAAAARAKPAARLRASGVSKPRGALSRAIPGAVDGRDFEP
jgi:single-strand DNA-binding protein